MSIRNTLLAILFVSLLGAFLSFLLLLQHHQQAHELYLVSMLCGAESISGCEAVNRSEYSSIAGLPLAAIGAMFYLSLSLCIGLSLFTDEKIKASILKVILFLVAIAAAADLILLGIQAFILQTFCSLCLLTYGVTAVLLFLLFKRKQKKGIPTFREVLARNEGRLLAGGWLLSTFAVMAAVWAANLSLENSNPSPGQKGFSTAAVEEYLRSPVEPINLQGMPFKGALDGPIQVVIYSDFLCPHCRNLASLFRQHFPKWKGRVTLYFKAYPVDPGCNPYIRKNIHPGSCWAALGGVCAGDQNKFWEYHDKFFELQPRSATPRDVLRIAAAAGVDTTALRECLDSDQHRRIVRAMIEDGHRHGIDGTPRIFVNGRKLSRLDYFPAIMQYEAQRLGFPPFEGFDE